MRPLNHYFSLIRHMGVGWVLYRASYALRRRSGALRRATTAVAWEEVPAPQLCMYPGKAPAVSSEWGSACEAEAEAVLRGRFRLFSHREAEAGNPPDWHRNQLTGEMAPADRHWSELGDIAFGDIKGVWELSRFPWAFALTRAYVRTGEGKYAEAFWRLFADWCERNPPNLGPNWMCGQEATFRLMAVTFAAEWLKVPAAQRELLARFVVATGRRINANLDYALSQKNNHGISECVGLITIALLAPSHAESASWLARGLSKLQAQCSELIYEDGGFAQHSLIYHRVVLHDLCWVHSRLTKAGQAVPAWLEAAGRRATAYLVRLVDPATGGAPLQGSNDGADVLPVADAGFLDMRPVIQMASALFHRELPLPAGPWDEAAGWLVADAAVLPRVPWPQPPARWHAPQAGSFQLAANSGRLFLRCPTYFRHRPGQADVLHVDVWHRGRAVAQDGGSFSYNSSERFVALKDAAQHNSLVVDQIEPLRKFSRFLYLPWPEGSAREIAGGGLAASCDAYDKLGVHWSREVAPQPKGDGFVVRDRVENARGRRVTWHWRLVDAPWQINDTADAVEVSAPGLAYRITWSGLGTRTRRLIRADKDSAYGWWSPHYGEVEPAMSLVLEAAPEGDFELTFQFQPLA